MLSSALLSLGVAGSALAWPSHSRHASIARALQAREEPVVANTTKAPVAATWFASWHAQDFPLSNVSWNKYTTVTYSFALTTPNVSFVNITDPDVFKDFVETAHANNVSASISVGGWTGSLHFSPAVATAENRTAFVKTMTDLVKDNNLDGLDFDWEYPGLAGIGCNALSANDTDNFLAFLTELRAALPNTTISAATSIKPFMSSDLTTPSTNVSAFASVFDYIAIMNYDIWGPWSDTVGPNAPLNDTCAANATQQVGSAVSAIEAWTKAGMPADQIVLGVAGYGHGFSVAQADALTSDNTISLYAPFNKTSIPAGDAWDEAPAAGAVDVCGNPQTLAGTWNFWGLVEGGFLNENGTANTAEGIVYKFDECSQTPYVFNKTSGIMVAFDDATSFAAKGQFINATGLRGFAMWEAAGDFDDILLDSIRNAAGFPAPIEDDDDGCGGDPSTGTTTDAAPAPTTTAASDPTTIADPEPTTIVDPEPTTVAAPAPTTKASNPSGATTKVSYGGSPTTKAGVAAAATTKEASSTRSTTASNPEPTADPADPDDEYDDDDCEDDDEDPETTSVAAATTASTSIAQATSTSQAASVAETSPVTSTVTSSAAAATATEDPDEECDDDEYDE